MNDQIKQKTSNLLKFIHLSEKLKCTLRHGWTSTGRQESVAEHSWRLSLLAILLSPHIGNKLNMERVLGMSIIHDLCEALTGDTPFFEALEGSSAKQKKAILEREAMKTLIGSLNKESGDQLKLLWEEYNKTESEEAKFVHALDKLEAQIQQNEADISTWNDFEKKSIFTYLDKFCDYNYFIKLFKDEVREESADKLNQSLSETSR